jgi:hypothetical protein
MHVPLYPPILYLPTPLHVHYYTFQLRPQESVSVLEDQTTPTLLRPQDGDQDKAMLVKFLLTALVTITSQ